MSAMKNYLNEQIEELAQKTGYSEEFLMDMWFKYTSECIEADDPVDWEHFKGVTLDRDW